MALYLIEKYRRPDVEAFANGVIAMTDRLAKNTGNILNPDWFMGIFHLETMGTFRADIQSPNTKATGLIQFMPDTARWLGTSVAALKKMTPLQQLYFVEKYYFKLISGRKIKSFLDFYLVTFYPSALAWEDEKEFSPMVKKANPLFYIGGEMDRNTIKYVLKLKYPKLIR